MLGDSHGQLENWQGFQIENCRFSDQMKTKLRTRSMIHSLLKIAPITFKVLKNLKKLKINNGISQYLSD
jgi:hypothetical protein